MSGASGSGISDRRRAADVKLTHSFERWSIGVGAAGSTENDYDSQSLSIDGKWWTSDKNTTIAAGIASDSDDIYSTNDPTFADTKKTLHYFLGVTQVVSPDTIVQSNLSYENANGYLSEPYKPLDHRPRSRDSLAWLTRYNHYLSELDASLHTDYRLYGDSFGIVSHMVEIALYKPVGETWLLRPNLRYYTQSHARFFSGTFPPRTSDAFFSADQRMSTFGGVTVGFKAEKELGAGWSANGSMDYLEQRQEWAPGGGSKAPIGRFVAPFFTLGISKKF